MRFYNSLHLLFFHIKTKEPNILEGIRGPNNPVYRCLYMYLHDLFIYTYKVNKQKEQEHFRGRSYLARKIIYIIII